MKPIPIALAIAGSAFIAAAARADDGAAAPETYRPHTTAGADNLIGYLPSG